MPGLAVCQLAAAQGGERGPVGPLQRPCCLHHFWSPPPCSCFASDRRHCPEPAPFPLPCPRAPDFGLLQHLRGSAPVNGGTPEHTVHTLHRQRVPSSTTLSSAGGADGNGGALGAEGSIGSMGGGAGGASPSRAPHSYVSEFGSLPPRDAAFNLHLNRILLTHAPYMTKLESLASSATR